MPGNILNDSVNELSKVDLLLLEIDKLEQEWSEAMNNEDWEQWRRITKDLSALYHQLIEQIGVNLEDAAQTLKEACENLNFEN